MKYRTSGFTLIELMIVVVIIGIMATIGYPSYQDSVKKSRRGDAQSALLGFAAAMERRYVNGANTYLGAANAGANTGTPAATLYPSQAPLDGNPKVYDLTIAAATATSYTLRADPITGGLMDGDGYLELLSNGQKQWDWNDDNAIAADGTESCWRC